MNKEFMFLEDGNVLVTNEDDNSRIRACEENIQDVLLGENKIEIANDNLNFWKKKLQSYNNVIFLSKSMLIAQPIIIFLVTLGFIIYGGMISTSSFLAGAIIYGVNGFVLSSIISVIPSIYFSIVRKVFKKKINKAEEAIKITQELKEQYEMELKNLKNEKENTKKPTILSETISLKEQTNYVEKQIDDETKTALINTCSQPQKLVLRRKK